MKKYTILLVVAVIAALILAGCKGPEVTGKVADQGVFPMVFYS